MSVKSRWVRVFWGFVVSLLVLVVGYSLLRPVILRWNATNEEVARAMPGDLPVSGWTRAITINAKPEAVWPWLLQFGQGRGGWYSYDWLENLLGFDIHTATQILPQFQNPAIGDPICMARSVCISNVFIIEPTQWFGWQAKTETGQPMWSFTFGLFPFGEGQTRLVVRESFGQGAMPPAALTAIEIPDVVMEQKMLAVIKDRVEGSVESPLATVFEIGVWLAALAMYIVAAVWYVTRPHWRTPLAVMAMAVYVLVVLTFLFPPYWLRIGLDLLLLAGLYRCGLEFRKAPAAKPVEADQPAEVK